MFARVPTALSFVALALLAAATPFPGGEPPASTTTVTTTFTATTTTTKTEPGTTFTVTGTGTCTASAPTATVTEPASNCTTGPVQCCESMESLAYDTQASTVPSQIILGLLGVFLKDLDVFLGLNCDPITGVGVGSGNECSTTTVCCENNAVGGLISIGCIPVFL